jgi:hypothetical protein
MNEIDNKFHKEIKQKLTNQMVAVVYCDDGPSGPCGQDCYTTSAWTRVYLFNNEDEVADWLKTQSFPKRKRSKTMMCFMDVNKSIGCQTLEFPLKKKD